MQNTEVTFTIKVEEDFCEAWLVTCKYHDWQNETRYPMKWIKKQGSQNVFSLTALFDKVQTYGYIFEFKSNSNPNIRFIVKKEDGNARISHQKESHWMLTVYDPELNCKEAGVFYQIFPDRFAKGRDLSQKSVPNGIKLKTSWAEIPDYMPQDGIVKNNDFYGGDLNGITSKLSYLKKLGITLIYLMPIAATQENHGYTVTNYLEVNSLLGTWEDLKELCEKAHAMGMRVILDAVFNHVGDQSIYFKEAISNRNSRYYNWFSFSEYPNKYESWWNFATLPSIRKNCLDYQSFITKEVLPFWFEKGIDGVRIDVADELTNDFLKSIGKTVKELGGSFVCAEVWENAARKEAYGEFKEYALGDKVNSTMNYPFKDAILRYISYGYANDLKNQVMQILEDYPKPMIGNLMNFISTHDTLRAMTTMAGRPMYEGLNDPRLIERRTWRAQNDKLSPKQYKAGKVMLKLATIIQYGLPGNPCIFYGDEVGVHGYKDPFNRKTYPWDNIDKDLLKFFISLGKIRKDYSDVFSGDFRFVLLHENALVFERSNEDTSILFSIVREKQGDVMIPLEYSKGADEIFEYAVNGRKVATIIVKQR